MKKILITGMNKSQCTYDYYLQQQLKVVPSQYSLIHCLKDMGWSVEQRPLTLGENLDEYNEVIVYIHSIQAFCQFIWSGLYAISAKPNCIVAFDDWQFDQIYASFIQYKKDLLDNPEKAYRSYLMDLWQGKETIDEIRKFHDNFLEAIEIILEGNNRILISSFDGGNTKLLNLPWKEDKMFRYNPNPYHLNRTPENQFGTKEPSIFSFISDSEIKKTREWNYASLVQNKTKKWLIAQNPDKWNWPVRYYGAKRGEHKSERLKENEMCEIFQKNWGCLMPGYFHAGSGWWRARPLQLADSGSILIGDYKEMVVLYRNEYLSNLKVSDIENMSDQDLTKTALMQKEALYAAHPLDKKIQQNELNRVIDA